MKTDTELVIAAAGGDSGAFGEIVTRYRSLVCAIAYSGIGNLALSEEVAQDTFVAAWKGLGGLREPGKLKAWIAGIARNLVKAAHRTRVRARTEPLEAAGDPAAPGESPLAQVLDREQQALVWDALAAIPETYREPLILFYREEQSVERVAEALDISPDAVKQRLSRGRLMLRDHVAAVVESVLARTRPGKAFTLAVLAVLPAAAPQAAAAGVAAAAAEGSAAAKGAAASGLSGAAFGPLLGLLGGYLGARASIENTRSPRERRYMARVAWTAAGLALAFSAVMLLGLVLFPRALGHLGVQLLLAGVYTAVLVAFIVRSNRRQRRIQVEDGTSVAPGTRAAAHLDRTTPGAIRASFAGGVFGSLCWMPILCFIARDYGVAVATIAFGLAVYAVSVRAALRRPQAFFRISMAEAAAVAAWTVVAVNWRWDAWMTAYRTSSAYEPMSDLPLWAINLLLAAVFLWIFARLALLDRRQNAPE